MRQPTQQSLVETTGEVRGMIAQRRFNSLRKKFWTMMDDPECPTVSVVCVLRAAFSARNMFPDWDVMVDSAFMMIRRRGEDTEVLRGLAK